MVIGSEPVSCVMPTAASFKRGICRYSTPSGHGSGNSADSTGVRRSITHWIWYLLHSSAHSVGVSMLSLPLRRNSPWGITSLIPPRSRRFNSRFLLISYLRLVLVPQITFVKFGCKYSENYLIITIFANKNCDYGEFWRDTEKRPAPALPDGSCHAAEADGLSHDEDELIWKR